MNFSFVMSCFLVLTDRAKSVTYWEKQTHCAILQNYSGKLTKHIRSWYKMVFEIFPHI